MLSRGIIIATLLMGANCYGADNSKTYQEPQLNLISDIKADVKVKEARWKLPEKVQEDPEKWRGLASEKNQTRDPSSEPSETPMRPWFFKKSGEVE